MEGYLRAAGRITTLALGDPASAPTEVHLQGAAHAVADGAHRRRADRHARRRVADSRVPGRRRLQLPGDAALDSDRTALRQHRARREAGGFDRRRARRPARHQSPDERTGRERHEPAVTAGPRHCRAAPRVAAAFLRQFEAPVDDLLAPQDYTLADSQIGSGFGITTLPHVRDFAISGPFVVTGVSDTVSRRIGLHVPADGRRRRKPGCAAEILKRLASQAYREPASARRRRGADGLLRAAGARTRTSRPASAPRCEALLASPRFVFRLEQPPADGARRATASPSPISTSPRGCRSSSGARCPTPSSSASPRPAG